MKKIFLFLAVAFLFSNFVMAEKLSSQQQEFKTKSYMELSNQTFDTLLTGVPEQSVEQIVNQKSQIQDYQSVQQLYFYALQNSWNIRLSKNNVRSALINEDIGRSYLYPQINASYSISRADDSDNQIYNTNSLGLSLSQFLFNYESFKRVDQLKVNTELQTIKARIAKQQLILDIADKWIAVLLASETMKLSDAEIKSYKKLRDRAKQSFAVGNGKKLDVAQADSVYGLAVANQIKYQNDLQIAKQNLANLTGIAISYIPEWRNLQKVVDLNAISQYAQNLDNSQIIKEKLLSVDDAILGIEAVRAQLFPTVSLNLNYNNIENEATNENSDPLLFSINGNLNLFNGFNSSLNIENSYIALSSAKELLYQTVQNERLNLLNTWSLLQADFERIPAIESQVQAAKIALNAYRQGYEIGTESLPDLLESERNYLNAQLGLYSTNYSYWLHYLKFKFIIGQLSEADLPE